MDGARRPYAQAELIRTAVRRLGGSVSEAGEVRLGEKFREGLVALLQAARWDKVADLRNTTVDVLEQALTAALTGGPLPEVLKRVSNPDLTAWFLSYYAIWAQMEPEEQGEFFK